MWAGQKSKLFQKRYLYKTMRINNQQLDEPDSLAKDLKKLFRMMNLILQQFTNHNFIYRINHLKRIVSTNGLLEEFLCSFFLIKKNQRNQGFRKKAKIFIVPLQLQRLKSGIGITFW